MGLPEQIHTGQGAQFESQLMTELCQLWSVNKTHTTSYHPQANKHSEEEQQEFRWLYPSHVVRTRKNEWDVLRSKLERIEEPSIWLLERQLVC